MMKITHSYPQQQLLIERDVIAYLAARIWLLFVQRPEHSHYFSSLMLRQYEVIPLKGVRAFQPYDCEVEEVRIVICSYLDWRHRVGLDYVVFLRYIFSHRDRVDRHGVVVYLCRALHELEREHLSHFFLFGKLLDTVFVVLQLLN